MASSVESRVEVLERPARRVRLPNHPSFKQQCPTCSRYLPCRRKVCDCGHDMVAERKKNQEARLERSFSKGQRTCKASYSRIKHQTLGLMAKLTGAGYRVALVWTKQGAQRLSAGIWTVEEHIEQMLNMNRGTKETFRELIIKLFSAAVKYMDEDEVTSILEGTKAKKRKMENNFTIKTAVEPRVSSSNVNSLKRNKNKHQVPEDVQDFLEYFENDETLEENPSQTGAQSTVVDLYDKTDHHATGQQAVVRIPEVDGEYYITQEQLAELFGSSSAGANPTEGSNSEVVESQVTVSRKTDGPNETKKQISKQSTEVLVKNAPPGPVAAPSPQTPPVHVTVQLGNGTTKKIVYLKKPKDPQTPSHVAVSSGGSHNSARPKAAASVTATPSAHVAGANVQTPKIPNVALKKPNSNLPTQANASPKKRSSVTNTASSAAPSAEGKRILILSGPGILDLTPKMAADVLSGDLVLSGSAELQQTILKCAKSLLKMSD